MGQFWDPKTTPRDPKMTQKGFPKQQKSNQKGPKHENQAFLNPRGSEKAIFGAENGSQDIISGPFGKVKTLSGDDFGSFWFLWVIFGTQNDPVEVPEGSKMIILDKKTARRGSKN